MSTYTTNTIKRASAAAGDSGRDTGKFELSHPFPSFPQYFSAFRIPANRSSQAMAGLQLSDERGNGMFHQANTTLGCTLIGIASGI